MQLGEAAENLHVIRTLMERAAIYRRALGPIMLGCGLLGVAAAGIGFFGGFSSRLSFGGLWLGTAALGVLAALALSRRQALRDREPFWSPPARRVAHAALPALFCGMALDAALTFAPLGNQQSFFVIASALFYGCALNGAGFFMTRGVRWLGWLFIMAGLGLLAVLLALGRGLDYRAAHVCMGALFGLLQLAYGAYLQFTAPRPTQSP